MNDQDSAATQTTWTNEAAEKWLSRIDGIERSGAPIRELLMEWAHLQPGEQVLDVGCGSGPSTAAAATAVHPGGMVTGIDIAAPMISAARQRVGDPDIEWIVGDAETYPLPEGHYDAIISQMGADVLHQQCTGLREPGSGFSCRRSAGWRCLAHQGQDQHVPILVQ